VNGVKAEEATVIRQITPRQRGAARLSFLGGKKKESSPSQEVADHVNGSGGDIKAHTRGLSKDSALHNMSQSPVVDREAAGDKRGVSLDLLSRNGVEAEEKKNKSVRKRFSLLKLGMKHSKTGALMGSLDEE
jgi:dedicator of cytokinesis protein 3